MEATAAGFDRGSLGLAYVVGGKGTKANLALARVPVVTDLRISGISSTAVLTWTHGGSAAAYYEVWWSETPYFAPGAAGAHKLTDVTPPTSGNTVSYEAGAVGDSNTHHFYVLQTVGPAGGTSLVSNRVGECTYSVTPGELSP